MSGKTPSDRSLGLNRPISRRDFVDGGLRWAATATAASLLPGVAQGKSGSPPNTQSYYPPQARGLRGSHTGSFELAHELAWQGKNDWGAGAQHDRTDYDLVVVGAGVSGLSAAYFYREQHPDARILILENHDDFGGHAKRNEFQSGGQQIIGYGGSQSLEAPSDYSATALGLLDRLGVSIDKLADTYDQGFFKRHGLGPAVHFDAATFGVDRTVKSNFVDASLFLPLAPAAHSIAESVAQMPIGDEAKRQLLGLFHNDADVLPDHSMFAEPEYLASISYLDFLKRHVQVTDPQVIELLRHVPNSYFGFGIDVLPAIEALAFGMPGLNGTSLGTFSGLIRRLIRWSSEPYIYHFPDGNASIARLLVHNLIPDSMDVPEAMRVVGAQVDYSSLDDVSAPTRLRLNSMVVNVAHRGDPTSTGGGDGVDVTYVQQGQTQKVKAKRVILACYNMAIPHLCPELPTVQKSALKQLVKIPLVYTNVLLNNWRAFESLGIGFAYSPGSWHKLAMLDFPVSMGDYKFSQGPDDPIVLHMNRAVTGTGDTPEAQSRAGRYELLDKTFESFERDIRQHLASLLSAADFDPARDIGGITVNRWPHGYAWNPNPLFNQDFAPGAAPHEIGRQPFGQIAIANSDAGARAYLDCAIDEAWRAVNDLS